MTNYLSRVIKVSFLASLLLVLIALASVGVWKMMGVYNSPPNRPGSVVVIECYQKDILVAVKKRQVKFWKFHFTIDFTIDRSVLEFPEVKLGKHYRCTEKAAVYLTEQASKEYRLAKRRATSDDRPGSLLTLADFNALSEAEATRRLPEYRRAIRQYDEMRRNVEYLQPPCQSEQRAHGEIHAVRGDEVFEVYLPKTASTVARR